MIELNKIYNMDCFEGIKLIDDESVDFVLTDPPYNINYKSNYGLEKYKKEMMDFNWDSDFNTKLLIDEMFRVLKKDTYGMIFGLEENINIMKENGCNRILVWDKNSTGTGNLNDFGIGYEFIFLFRKGIPKIKGNRVNGVIRFDHWGYFDKTLHPTQKPEELLRFLIEKCSNKGDIVLDFCMGSGSTAVACKQTQRRFIGFEIDKKYWEISQQRLKQQNIFEWL